MKLDGVIALLELGNKTRFDAFVSQRLSNFGHLGGAGRGSALELCARLHAGVGG